MRLEKWCGQDIQNLVGHAKESGHSSGGKGMLLGGAGYFKQQGQAVV